MPKLIESPKLMDKEPYASIMNLLEICREFHPKYDGLTHAHFLYALTDNPMKNGEKKDELKKYFEQLETPHKKIKSLYHLYDKKQSLLIWQLDKGCIKWPQRLNEKLNSLIALGWIDPKGKPKYRRYYSSKKFQRFVNKTLINWKLDKFDDKTLKETVEIVFSIGEGEKIITSSNGNGHGLS